MISLAIIEGRILWYALPFIAAFAVASFICYRPKTHDFTKFVAGFITILLDTCLFLRKIPGFVNLQIYQDIQLSSNLTLLINFSLEKQLVSCFLVLFAISPIRTLSEWKNMFVKIYPYIILFLVLIVTIAVMIGYAVFDPKMPDNTIIRALNKLFYTCLVEEVFFRGFIQNNIISCLKKYRHKNIISLIITSLLFGIAHLRKGIVFVLLAFIAGIFYGFVYIKSKRIEASILAHFCLNFIRLIFFS